LASKSDSGSYPTPFTENSSLFELSVSLNLNL